MRQQRPHPRLRREPRGRVGPGHADPDLRARAGLRVTAVTAQPDLQRGPERHGLRDREGPRALQQQPQPVRVRRRLGLARYGSHAVRTCGTFAFSARSMPPEASCRNSAPLSPSAPIRIETSVHTGARPSSNVIAMSSVPPLTRPQAVTRSPIRSRV